MLFCILIYILWCYHPSQRTHTRARWMVRESMDENRWKNLELCVDAIHISENRLQNTPLSNRLFNEPDSYASYNWMGTTRNFHTSTSISSGSAQIYSVQGQRASKRRKQQLGVCVCVGGGGGGGILTMPCFSFEQWNGASHVFLEIFWHKMRRKVRSTQYETGV